MQREFSILLVDDEDPILELYRAMLEKYYHPIFTSPGALEALETIRKENIHLIITDMRMPWMDGHRLLEVIRKKHPNILVILSTGQQLNDSEMESLIQLGVSGFLFKPTGLNEMLDCVENAYNLHMAKNRT